MKGKRLNFVTVTKRLFTKWQKVVLYFILFEIWLLYDQSTSDQVVQVLEVGFA